MVEVQPSTQQLINNCQGLVRTIAWKIHIKLPKSVDLEDLVSYGQIGLAEAARDFDAGRGGQFTTYAYHRIRGAILDGLSKMSWFNHSDFYSGKYERCANDTLSADRAHDSGEGLDEDIRWFGAATARLAVVHLLCQASPDGEPMAVEDHDAPSPPAEVIRSELSQRIHQLIDDLPADARSLIRSTYFDGKSLKEAGEQIGVSKAWASRLHARTLGQLARSLRLAQLVD